MFEKVYKNSFAPSTTELIDFCSGNYLLGHNFFDGSKQKLRIYLYCDDIEVCNPLGFSKSKNKLMCVYMLAMSVRNSVHL